MAVPAPRTAAAAASRIASATTSVANDGHLSPQVRVNASGAILASGDQDEPAGNAGGSDGPEWTAEALAEALNGADRKLVLARIAATDPEVVMMAAAWLAEERAEGAERRRVTNNRRSKDRRRRQRAETGETWPRHG